jgi:hypothetical protein
MAIKKSWVEKLHDTRPPVVKPCDAAFADIPAGGMMLIATPLLIDAYIRQISDGKTVSVGEMRKGLALAHHAEYTCPLTTGIFLRIVSEAAYEHYLETQSLEGVTPFWRVVAPNAPLAKKLRCGKEFIEEQRKKEGIAV